MPDKGNPETDGESEDEPNNLREHRISKNPRYADPEDAGPRDPATEQERESGFEDVLEGDGATAKSVQEQLDSIVEGWDPLGTDEPKQTEPADLTWSEEDFADDPTETLTTVWPVMDSSYRTGTTALTSSEPHTTLPFPHPRKISS